MKKILSFIIIALFVISARAQIMFDDFETNQYGWTEKTRNGGLAVIKDGFMCIEVSKGYPDFYYSTCYAPFDYNKPFTMSVDVLIDDVNKGLLGSGAVGLLFDYEDDQNYIAFNLYKDHAVLTRKVSDQIVARKSEDLKLDQSKGTGFQIDVEYTLNELTFRVNGIKALSYRRRVPYGEFLLGTSGIGLSSGSGKKVRFDNLKIEQ